MASVLALTVLCASCTRETAAPTTGPRDPRIAQAAVAWLRDRHPDWLDGAKGLPTVIGDRGEGWEFTYELPNNMAGGVPVVLVDKRTLAVKDGYHTQ